MDAIPMNAFGDETSLTAWLNESGVDTNIWGMGAAKTVAHLLAELRNGDCELRDERTGLVRVVRNVWIDVYAVAGGETQHLVERRQVFNDGRIRERQLPASLGEKCKINEDPAVAAMRGVAEELSLTGRIEVLLTKPRRNPIGASSYPGLRTHYQTYWFTTELPDDAYQPEGYVEVQSDKCTYFEWES